MQSLVQTNDKAMRLSFKDALAHKVEHALAAPPPGPVKDSTISTLLVPSNYAELSAVSLHFSLLHNKELKHSRQTANLAVDIICGNTDKPANVELKVVELKNPVAIPVFAQKTEVKRSPARPLTAPDSKQARLAVEAVKENEYRHYLANMFQRVDQPVEVREETLRVPSNWNDLTEKELFFTLTNQTELEHSRTSAYRAMDILSGKIVKPAGVTLQEVVIFRPVAQPKAPAKEKATLIPAHVLKAEKPKRDAFKTQLADKASKTAQASEILASEQILLLPAHYKELSEVGLFYTLTHNAELKHSHTTAQMAVDILNGRVTPCDVKFETVNLAVPTVETLAVKPAIADPLDGFIPERELEKREQHKEFLAEKARVAYNTKPEFKAEAERVILLPENYKSMNPGELHFALIRNPEFKHTNQQAVVTADMLSGRIGTPENVVFRTLKVENVQLAPSLIKAAATIEAPKTAKTEATLLPRAKIPMGSEGKRVILLPSGYAGMTETQLHFALSHNREYGHSYESTYETIDIVFGRKACPDGTTFSTVLVENPVERAY